MTNSLIVDVVDPFLFLLLFFSYSSISLIDPRTIFRAKSDGLNKFNFLFFFNFWASFHCSTEFFVRIYCLVYYILTDAVVFASVNYYLKQMCICRSDVRISCYWGGEGNDVLRRHQLTL